MKNDRYAKLFRIPGTNYTFDEETAERLIKNGTAIEELPRVEDKDFGFLITKEYIDFFTDPASPFKAVFAGDGTNNYSYPDVMDKFREDVEKADSLIEPVIVPKNCKPVWAGMRDKFFDGKAYVYPDEMMTRLNEFSVSEMVAFLHYCVVYKERFCDGAYGDYASSGFIGQILIKLKKDIGND